MTRLAGSGTVPRVFALVVLAVVSIFLAVWSGSGGPLPGIIVIETLALGLAVRSLFVGVLLAGDAVVIRGWFRDHRYERGSVRAVEAVPYWKFLDKSEPLLALLKVTPTSGWVREITATVASKERARAHAAAVQRHLEAGSVTPDA
ncbi:MAG TPA: hypothetical protein VNR36_05990 [Pseudolysinimonas sp.]|nr:hypothetical protein [Pseudolysinimonas sp.]